MPYSQLGQVLSQPAEEVKKTFSYTPKQVTYVSNPQPFDSILFVGDILLARNVEFLMSRLGAEYPYQGLDFTQFSQSPAVIGNFESAIPLNHVPTPMNTVRFSVDTRYLPALRAAGITNVSLANNHSLDFGADEFEYTVSALEKSGIEVFGHQSTISQQAVSFVEIENTMVAVIGFHTLQTLPNYTELKEVFDYATARSDFQVAYVHWGTEYVPVHNNRQREAAERFVEAGADLIVGQHPHVVQDVDLIKGVPVFYSLGNYIFDQYDTLETKEGLLLQLTFTDTPAVAIIPVSSAQTLSQPALMSESAHAQFLEDLAQRSNTELKSDIKFGLIKLPNIVASSSEMTIMTQ